MAGPQRIEWRRRVPVAAIARLGWYVLSAALLVGAVWALFGDEPDQLSSGAENPLVNVVPTTLLLVALGGLPFVVAIARRPVVAANHYALTVRPGAMRTLVLPWAQMGAIAAYRIGGEPYLLVRCRESLDSGGDQPGWADQRALRVARRHGDVPGTFDLAVRMRDFVGAPQSLLGTLAAFAPDHVKVTSELVRDR